MNARLESLTGSYGASYVRLGSVKNCHVHVSQGLWSMLVILIWDDNCLHLLEDHFCEVVWLWLLFIYLEYELNYTKFSATEAFLLFKLHQCG